MQEQNRGDAGSLVQPDGGAGSLGPTWAQPVTNATRRPFSLIFLPFPKLSNTYRVAIRYL
jgi:hypothetical protein